MTAILIRYFPLEGEGNERSEPVEVYRAAFDPYPSLPLSGGGKSGVLL